MKFQSTGASKLNRIPWKMKSGGLSSKPTTALCVYLSEQRTTEKKYFPAQILIFCATMCVDFASKQNCHNTLPYFAMALAENVSKFYHFVSSPPPFLYLLFTLNTDYAASHQIV